MQYEQFIQKLESQLGPGQLDAANPGQAEMAVQATLATLGERITGGEAGDLASQLPAEIKSPLDLKSEEEAAEDFSLQEFYRRVAEREGSDIATAGIHASAVIKTLREAVTGGEVDDIHSQLPQEFDPLFG